VCARRERVAPVARNRVKVRVFQLRRILVDWQRLLDPLLGTDVPWKDTIWIWIWIWRERREREEREGGRLTQVTEEEEEGKKEGGEGGMEANLRFNRGCLQFYQFWLGKERDLKEEMKRERNRCRSWWSPWFQTGKQRSGEVRAAATWFFLSFFPLSFVSFFF